VNGNLYIVVPGSRNVLEYPPNSTKPNFTYSQGLYSPVVDVTTDHSLNVYVANGSAFSEYPQDTNAAIWSCATGSRSGFGWVKGIGGGGPLESYAFDGTIISWGKGVRSPCTGAVLTQGVVNSPGELATDSKGKILVCDGSKIDILGGGPLLKLKGHFGSGFKHVIQIRLNNANTQAYITDGGLNEVFVTAYPSGKILHTLHFAKVYAAVDGDNYNP